MNPATPPVDPASTPPRAGESDASDLRGAATAASHPAERDAEQPAEGGAEDGAESRPLAESQLAGAPQAESAAAEAEKAVGAASVSAGAAESEGDPTSASASTAAEPEIRAALDPEIASSAGSETLPVPAGPRRIDSPGARPGKINFWKRIAMRRTERARNAAQTAELLAKVGDLDERLESTQATILGRLDRMEEQIESVWVVEEQLSQLSEIQGKLDSLRSEQRGIIEAVAGSGGQTARSRWGSRFAFVVLLAAAAAGAIALVKMGL
ncbi:MAG: hypothetical protein JRG96_03680 [Deltaproteobacteria bacterium]|nr:hypothetical protein [Deltaproteobacteria bacterium]MBW2418441.1 hypothetical protein [Deltaproteobacteria bacterium]